MPQKWYTDNFFEKLNDAERAIQDAESQTREVVLGQDLQVMFKKLSDSNQEKARIQDKLLLGCRSLQAGIEADLSSIKKKRADLENLMTSVTKKKAALDKHRKTLENPDALEKEVRVIQIEIRAREESSNEDN